MTGRNKSSPHTWSSGFHSFSVQGQVFSASLSQAPASASQRSSPLEVSSTLPLKDAEEQHRAVRK